MSLSTEKSELVTAEPACCCPVHCSKVCVSERHVAGRKVSRRSHRPFRLSHYPYLVGATGDCRNSHKTLVQQASVIPFGKLLG